MCELINLDVLSQILDINLVCPPEKFDMRTYEGSENGPTCETTHCLIGNYLVHNNRFCVHNEIYSIRFECGLSLHEYSFLFSNLLSHQTSKSAASLSQKEALTRLAKFIIYKRRKKKLWEDYEKARRTEGDNMFCNITQDEIEGVLV